MHATVSKTGESAEKAKPAEQQMTTVAGPALDQTSLWAQGLPVQFNLKVNQPGDRYEQEADRVSEHAIRMTAPRLQRKTCACGRPAGPEGLCTECRRRQPRVQRKTISEGGQTAVPSILQDVIQTPGRALDASTRNFMESRLGHRFGRVQLHTTSRASASAQALNASAYTVGNHIVFGANRYQPDTLAGRHLLAHELVHTIQQGGTDGASAGHGREAHTTPARIFLQRQPVPAGASPQAGKDWFMLKPPPIYRQKSYTCWAASLASWLNVRNMSNISDEGLLRIYQSPPSTCLDPRGVLLYTHDTDVFGEWWMELKKVDRANWEDVKTLLRTYGHLLVATGTDASVAHDMVIYGYGFDENGEPCSGCVSLMDPATGIYRNDALYNLGFPLYLGIPKAQRGDAANCRQRPLP